MESLRIISNLNNSLQQLLKYADGFHYHWEATNAMNIGENAPVLYRGLEVGAIKKIRIKQIR